MNKPTEQLFEDQNFFQSILDTAIDGIIIIDVKGHMILANPSVAKLFGYELSEIIGQKVNLLMPEPHKTKHEEYIRNHMDTGIKKIIGLGREVLGQRKDGSMFPIRLGVSRFMSKDQLFFTGVIHDLSAQKEAESNLWFLNKNLEKLVESRTGQLQESLNQLNSINKNLEYEIELRKIAEDKLRSREKELIDSVEKERSLNLLKSRFVSIASHEFRTPLANILSSLDLIERYAKEEQLESRTKHITKVRANIHYLNGILNEFLGLTRIEEGLFELHNESFCFKAFLNELIEDFNLLKKPGQIFHVDIKNPDQSYMIYTDKNAFKLIFNNLVSNAIKFSGEQSNFWISLNSNGDEYTLRIQDEGIGIPDEEKKYIFDIFYRASNVLNIQGTGLGLNIAKKYLDLINGKIDIESEEGSGTTITIHIPISYGQE